MRFRLSLAFILGILLAASGCDPGQTTWKTIDAFAASQPKEGQP